MIRRTVPLSEAVAAARIEHAAEVDDLAAWSKHMGREVDPDIVALLHAVEKHERPDSPDGWDRAAFYNFYRCDLWNWCSIADCDYPVHELPKVLWLWLHHRSATGRWPPGDEPLHELLKVLLCYSELGFDGRQMQGGRTDRLIPCECFVSRDLRLPLGEPPTVADLVAEADVRQGPVRRHRDGAAVQTGDEAAAGVGAIESVRRIRAVTSGKGRRRTRGS